MAIFIHRRTLTCLKKGLLALALVFSLPVFAAEHWIDVRVPEQYQQEHVQGAINIPLKEVKERIATAVPDKNDTVKCIAMPDASPGRQKSSLARWDIPTLRTPVA